MWYLLLQSGIGTLPLEFLSAAVCEQLRSAETIAVRSIRLSGSDWK
jgi:hypothetical protein